MSDADIMAKSYAKEAEEAMEENTQEDEGKIEPMEDPPPVVNNDEPLSLTTRFGRKTTPTSLVTGSILSSFRYGHNSKLACRFCGKTFSQAGYIKAHERLHTGEKPFACSICGKRFSDPSNWKKHERVHNNQSSRSSPAPSPPKPTPPPTPNNLSSQSIADALNITPSMSVMSKMSEDEERKEKERSLVIRAASSLITSSIQQRMRQADGSSPVICKICGKLFSSQSSLSTHKRIHTGERPYSCRSCGKSFTQIGTLRTHERIHTGEKPYICKVCGRTFAQSGSYRMHERRHMTDAIQRCHICYATFTKWQDLQQHMASHPHVTESVNDYANFSRLDMMNQKSDPKDEIHSNQTHDGVLIDDLPYHSQAQSLYQSACQLPPFSSIIPFRAPVGTTFSPSFPPPIGMYNSAAGLTLAESSELGLLRPHYFPSMSLATQLKLPEPSPAQENEVVSTTSQSQVRKDGSDSSPLVSTPDANDTSPKNDFETELDLSRHHARPTSESSDTGSQSPEGIENNGVDAQQLSIERQNLNTRMIPSSSNGRKQRHPMRRCSSSTSSEQELPQSTSSLLCNGATDIESPKDEDQALVSYLLWKGKVYKCEHCHMIFEDCTLYLLHNGFHSHDSDPFKCVICKVSCKDRIDFNCHLTSHIK
ncbi:zinc finger protein 619-like [Gigantopelta aegis]|uniref:zinc finger protein 619-like n=1 Tax=Gigantopelta aegis TaxID=1735272 RepID=UPI001B88DADE|nr:zinc finger protein 619-like [Gigantopelta aegis]